MANDVKRYDLQAFPNYTGMKQTPNGRYVLAADHDRIVAVLQAQVERPAMTEWSELKQLAEAVPQAPWSYEATGFIVSWDGTESGRCDTGGDFRYVCEGVDIFRDYLLSLHPSSVLALIAEVEQLTAQRDRLKERCRELEAAIEQRNGECSRLQAEVAEVAGMTGAQLKADNELLAGMWQAIRVERDTLRAEVEQFKAANAELSELNAARRRHLNNAKKAAGIGPDEDLVGTIELLRKDAERYRLLRAGNDYQYDGPMVVLYEKSSDVGERPYWSLAAEALDETIDSAMEASR